MVGDFNSLCNAAAIMILATIIIVVMSSAHAFNKSLRARDGFRVYIDGRGRVDNDIIDDYYARTGLSTVWRNTVCVLIASTFIGVVSSTIMFVGKTFAYGDVTDPFRLWLIGMIVALYVASFYVLLWGLFYSTAIDYMRIIVSNHNDKVSNSETFTDNSIAVAAVGNTVNPVITGAESLAVAAFTASEE